MFKENVNNGTKLYKLGINKFTDLTSEDRILAVLYTTTTCFVISSKWF